LTIAGDFYGDITTHNGELKETNMERLPAPPVNADQGRLYYNTTNKHYYGYNGTSWILLETLPDVTITALEDLGSLVDSATDASTPGTLVLRDENGSFEGDFYNGVDFHNSEIKNALCENLASHPLTPTKSRLYFNTTDNRFYGYNGTTWGDLSYDKNDVLNDFYTKEEITAIQTSLQGQIDGNISTWFYEVVPSTSNVPYTTWTTTALKNQHLGDLYYNTLTGYCYRFSLVESVYQWLKVTDTDVTKALADVIIAQATADNKKRVFSLTPYAPYDIGDLWAQGSSGDLMRCKTSLATGGTYSASHWERAFKWDMARSTYDTNASGVVDNAEKVNGFSVLTAVPSGAVFTDTVTSINGKTGVITKNDIVALGIPSQDTIYSHPPTHEPSIITQNINNRFVTDAQISTWDGKQSTLGFTPENTSNKGQINGYAELGIDGKVPLTQLPTMAEGHTHTNKTVLDKISGGIEVSYDLDTFVTDSQLADLGAGDMLKSTYDTTNNGIVDNAEKVNGLTVATAVPVNAVFTDTITTVNGKTGAILKADIVALGIPTSDTVYVHPTNHSPSIISQDPNNRFVTDDEKTAWNGKQSSLGFTPENTSNKGQANGYATLGSDSKVPLDQLPTIPEGHSHSNKTIIDKIIAGTSVSYDLDSFTTDTEFNEVVVARNTYLSLDARLDDFSSDIDAGVFGDSTTEVAIDGGLF